jgi:hypothetical protein
MRMARIKPSAQKRAERCETPHDASEGRRPEGPVKNKVGAPFVQWERLRPKAETKTTGGSHVRCVVEEPRRPGSKPMSPNMQSGRRHLARRAARPAESI